jgi:hypothetical protein
MKYPVHDFAVDGAIIGVGCWLIPIATKWSICVALQRLFFRIQNNTQLTCSLQLSHDVLYRFCMGQFWICGETGTLVNCIGNIRACRLLQEIEFSKNQPVLPFLILQGLSCSSCRRMRVESAGEWRGFVFCFSRPAQSAIMEAISCGWVKLSLSSSDRVTFIHQTQKISNRENTSSSSFALGPIISVLLSQ